MTMANTTAASRRKLFRVRKLRQLWRVVRESDAQPMVGEPRRLDVAKAGETGVTFIGHSSFLLQMGGKKVLVDPVFATRLIVLRRQRRPGLAVGGDAGDRRGAADACAYGSSEYLVAAEGGAGDEAAARGGSGGGGAAGGRGPGGAAGICEGA